MHVNCVQHVKEDKGRGGDYSELFLKLLVLDAFFHKTTKNYLQKILNNFLTPVPGV